MIDGDQKSPLMLLLEETGGKKAGGRISASCDMFSLTACRARGKVGRRGFMVSLLVELTFIGKDHWLAIGVAHCLSVVREVQSYLMHRLGSLSEDLGLSRGGITEGGSTSVPPAPPPYLPRGSFSSYALCVADRGCTAAVVVLHVAGLLSELAQRSALTAMHSGWCGSSSSSGIANSRQGTVPYV